MCRFMSTQSAAFYLRTAPIIDKNFKMKHHSQNEIMSSREIELGIRKFDKNHDTGEIFEESEKLIMTNYNTHNNRQ